MNEKVIIMDDFDLMLEFEQKGSNSSLFREMNSFFLDPELVGLLDFSFDPESVGLLNSSEGTGDVHDTRTGSSGKTSSSASSANLSANTKRKNADDDRPTKSAPKKKIKLGKVTVTYSKDQPPTTSGLLEFPSKLTQAINAGYSAAISKLIDDYCVDDCKLVTIVSDDVHEGKVFIKEFFKKWLEISPDSIITFHNEVFVDSNTIIAHFSCSGTIVGDAMEEQAIRLFFKDGIVLSDKVVDTSKLSKEKIIKLKELEKELKKENKPIVHITNGLAKYSYAICDDGKERFTVFEYNWRTSMIKDGSLEI